MTFRFARHTNQIEGITKFYTEILGFELIGEFKNHDNYNGVFLGRKNTDWHLEFTESNDLADYKFDEDDLLIFYPTTNKEYTRLMNSIKEHGIKKIIAKNPYWRENGFMFPDPDGYKIVISPLRITLD